MAQFQFVAKTPAGKTQHGLRIATSRQDLLRVLAEERLFPIRITPVADSPLNHLFRRSQANRSDIIRFTSQLSDLLSAGVPLLQALEVIERQTSKDGLRSIVQDIRTKVQDGKRLAAVLDAHRPAFSSLAISMIRAGEEGGFLDVALARIASLSERQENLRRKIVGAMAYPLFLFATGSSIVLVLVLFFVPKFEPVFERFSQHGGLPWPTQILLGLSHALQNHLGIVFIAFLGLLFATYRISRDPRVGRLMQKLTMLLPLYGQISKALSVSRFCRTLGTLLTNGVPLVRSLKIAKESSANVQLEEAIDQATSSVVSGKRLAIPLKQSGQFPSDVVEMIAVSEESNNLESVLVEIADKLERRTNELIDVAVRLLEPLFLLVVSAFVGFIVIALLLPIFNSASALGI